MTAVAVLGLPRILGATTTFNDDHELCFVSAPGQDDLDPAWLHPRSRAGPLAFAAAGGEMWLAGRHASTEFNGSASDRDRSASGSSSSVLHT